VNLGVSTRNGALAVGATSLAVTSAVPFSPDMLPFLLTIDSGASQKRVQISIIPGTTFTISPCALANNTGVAARADDFHIAGFSASANVANLGNAYLGTRGMATGRTLNQMLNSQDGDPGTITEFKIDVTTGGDALNFVAWVR
jgi:hypothetical protein